MIYPDPIAHNDGVVRSTAFNHVSLTDGAMCFGTGFSNDFEKKLVSPINVW